MNRIISLKKPKRGYFLLIVGELLFLEGSPKDTQNIEFTQAIRKRLLTKGFDNTKQKLLDIAEELGWTRE